MRISTSMQYQSHLNYLQTANTKVDQASTQYNTGLKFQTAGQDPGGMAAKIKYQADITAYERYGDNAKVVSDALDQEETALGQIWDVMSSIQTRLIQAINGTLDDGSRQALAEDIKQSRDQLYSLMNTKNAEGEYIFSGAQSNIPTFTVTSDGNYVCNADGSTKNVNVSPTITVQTTDSGLNIFENVMYAYDFGIRGQDLDSGGTIAAATVSDYDQFNAFFKDNFTYGSNGEAAGWLDNAFVVIINGDGTFELHDGDKMQPGSLIAEGEIKDNKIEVKGMSFTLPNDYELPSGLTDPSDPTSAPKVDSIVLELEQPSQGNILNKLTEIVNKLSLPQDEWDTISQSTSSLTHDLAEMQQNIELAKKQVDTYRGMVGARGANIDAIIQSDESLTDIKKEAKANVSEMDAFEAVSNLLVAQNALQVAQQSYNLVHSTTLFDYMR